MMIFHFKTHIMTLQELKERDTLKTGEIVTMMDEHCVLEMDMAELLGVSHATLKSYMSSSFPKKHHTAIKEFFIDVLERYGNPGDSKKKKGDPAVEKALSGNPSKEDEAEPEPEPDQPEDNGKKANENSIKKDMNNEKKFNDNFDYLKFDRIVFMCKEGASDSAALEEAIKFSDKAGVPIHLRINGKVVRISVE